MFLKTSKKPFFSILQKISYFIFILPVGKSNKSSLKRLPQVVQEFFISANSVVPSMDIVSEEVHQHLRVKHCNITITPSHNEMKQKYFHDYAVDCVLLQCSQNKDFKY